MTSPQPIVIKQEGWGQAMQQGLNPLMQALQELEQQKKQAEQIKQSTEAHKIRMEMMKAQLEAVKTETAGQALFGEMAATFLEPQKPGTAAKPQERPTARGAVTTVARKAPQMLGQALQVFPKLEELASATERQEAADRLYANTVDDINRSDPLLGRVLTVGNALQQSGIDPAFVRQLTSDMLTQGRSAKTERSLARLRADPAYASAADLPDEDFLMVVREIKKQELIFALGLHREPMPKTKEEFVLQHLPKLAFPSTDFFGMPHEALRTPEDARDFLGGLWDRVHESPLRVQVRSHRLPLQDVTEETIARSVYQSLDSEPTMAEIKAYITQILSQDGQADPKKVERILLRIGALSLQRQAIR